MNRYAVPFGVEVRQLPEDHPASPGYGVSALRVLTVGTYLPGYVGERLNRKQFLLRYPAGDARYVLESSEDTLIDAVNINVANYSRMINHPLNVNGPDKKKAKANARFEDVNAICILSKVGIGQEILIDYGLFFVHTGIVILSHQPIKAGINIDSTCSAAVVEGTIVNFGQVINGFGTDTGTGTGTGTSTDTSGCDGGSE
jgi:hypothetical protein